MTERIAPAMTGPETGPYDLHLDETGNLAMVRNSEAIGQHARQRLQSFEGEWFLDLQSGVPWLTDVMGKRFDPVLADAVMKSCLLDTDGVTEVTGFSTTFDRATRNLKSSSISVATIYDEEVSL
ncbi:hypothetical protein [Roseibium alexandrii]|uniref:Uncharacterized protein n=1 Tax=Roseibium alexandrii TaxID=388408 RepID=A0A0M6ZY62_9HYPH|nr:hypothetical protein [Roseibium alexandrii]CTQ67102.1 hypothetical protein LAX5112_01213 [Roseibium alexandrii]